MASFRLQSGPITEKGTIHLHELRTLKEKRAFSNSKKAPVNGITVKLMKLF